MDRFADVLHTLTTTGSVPDWTPDQVAEFTNDSSLKYLKWLADLHKCSNAHRGRIAQRLPKIASALLLGLASDQLVWHQHILILFNPDATFWTLDPQRWATFIQNPCSVEAYGALCARITDGDSPTVKHFDSCFLITHARDPDAATRVVDRFSIEFDDPDFVGSIGDDLILRLFTNAFDYVMTLKEDDLDDDAIVFKMLDTALSQLQTESLNRKLFAAKFFARALHRVGPEIPMQIVMWAQRTKPILLMFEAAGHNPEVLKILRCVVPPLSPVAEVADGDLLEFYTWARGIDPEIRHLALELVADAMTGITAETAGNFLPVIFSVEDAESREDFSRLIGFAGKILLTGTEDTADLFYYLFLVLDEGPDCVRRAACDMMNAANPVCRSVVQAVFERNKEEASRNAILFGILNDIFRLANGEILKPYFVEIATAISDGSKPEYQSLIEAMLNRMPLPLEDGQAQAFQLVLQQQPELFYTVMEAAFANRGVKIFADEFYAQIFKGWLRLQFPPLPIILNTAADIAFELVRSKAGNEDVQKMLLSRAQSVMNGYYQFFLQSKPEEDEHRRTLVGLFIKIYRALPDSSRAELMKGICYEMRTDSFHRDPERRVPKIILFVRDFILRWESLIPDDWINIVRHKDLSEQYNIPVTLTRSGASNLSMKVNRNTFLCDVQDAVAVNLRNSWENILLNRPAGPLHPWHTFGDYGLEPPVQIQITVNQEVTTEHSLPVWALGQQDPIMNTLFEALDDQNEETKRYSWKLLQVLPTHGDYLENMKVPDIALSFFKANPTPLKCRYIYQIVLKFIQKRVPGFEVLVDDVVARIKNGPLFHELFAVANSEPVRAAMVGTLDADIIERLVGAFLEGKPKTRRIIAELLAEFITKKADCEDWIQANPEFFRQVVIRKIDGVEGLFSALKKRKECFSVLAAMAPEVVNQRDIYPWYFKILTAVVTADCEARPFLELIRAPEYFEPLEPTVLAFHAKCIGQKNDLAKDLDEFAARMLDEALVHPVASIRTSLFDLVFALAKDEGIKRMVVAKVLNFVDLQTDEWKIDPTGQRDAAGLLTNLGATDYINCLLQMLYFNIPFVKDLYEAESKEPLVLELRHVFENLALFKAGRVKTEDFATNAWAKVPGVKFDPAVPVDISEFAKKFFASLPPEVSRSFRGEVATFYEGIDRDNPFRRDGTVEPFYLLRIPVGDMTFYQSMSSITQPELIKGEYRDESLGKLDVRKYVRYLRLPQLLIILLGRIETTKVSQRRALTHLPFEFPQAFKASDYFVGQSGLYQLKGVVNHIGTVDAPKFKTFMRVDEEWTLFDGDKVTIVPDDSARFQQVSAYGQNNCAYLLLYENVGPEPQQTVKVPGSVSRDPIVELIRGQIAEADLTRITSANDEMTRMSTLFAYELGKFIVDIADFKLAFQYFLQVFCHGQRTDIATPLLDYFRQALSENKSHVDEVVVQLTPMKELIMTLIAKAAPDIANSVAIMLSYIFLNGNQEQPETIVTNFLSDAMRYMNVMDNDTIFRYLGRLTHSYLEKHRSSAPVIAPLVVDLVDAYYKPFVGVPMPDTALAKLSVPHIWRVLQLCQGYLPEDVGERLVNTLTDIVWKAPEVRVQFVKFILQVVPKQAFKLKQRLTEEIVTRVLAVTLIEEDLNALKTAFNISSIMKSFKRDFVIRFPKSTVLEPLTSPDQALRYQAETFIYQTFSDIGNFVNFRAAEDLVRLPDWPHFVPNETKEVESQTLKTDIEGVWDKATGYFEEDGLTLGQNAAGLVRVCCWFKCRMKKTEIQRYGEKLLEYIRRDVHPDCVLLELLRLISATVAQEEVQQFYGEHKAEVLQAITFEQSDTLHRFFAIAYAFGINEALLDHPGVGEYLEGLVKEKEENKRVKVGTLREFLEAAKGHAKDRVLNVLWKSVPEIMASKDLLGFFRTQPINSEQVQAVMNEFFAHKMSDEAFTFVGELVDNHDFVYAPGTFKRSVVSPDEVVAVGKVMTKNLDFARDVINQGVEQPSDMAPELLPILCDRLAAAAEGQPPEFVENAGQILQMKLHEGQARQAVEQCLTSLGGVVEKCGLGNWSAVLMMEMGAFPLAVLRGEGAGTFIMKFMAAREDEWVDDAQYWFDCLDDIGNEKFAPAVIISAWIFKAVPLAREMFLDMRRMAPEILRDWPGDLAEFKDLFLPPIGDEVG